jgi:hypothetical protein
MTPGSGRAWVPKRLVSVPEASSSRSTARKAGPACALTGTRRLSPSTAPDVEGPGGLGLDRRRELAARRRAVAEADFRLGGVVRRMRSLWITVFSRT